MYKIIFSTLLFVLFSLNSFSQDISFTTKNYCSTNIVQPYDVGYAKSSQVCVSGDTVYIYSFGERPVDMVIRKYKIDYVTEEPTAPYISVFICNAGDIIVRIYPAAQWAQVVYQTNNYGFTMLFHNYDIK